MLIATSITSLAVMLATTAQMPEATGESGPTTTDEQPRFTLSFTPYVWLTSFNGTVAGRGVETEVEKSFADIVSDTDSVLGLMGEVDLSAGPFVFSLNAAYTSAAAGESGGIARSGPLGGSTSVGATLDVELESAWIEALGGYRVLEAPLADHPETRLRLDVFGGVRYTTLRLDIDATADATITLPGGEVLTGGVSRELNQSSEWFEPFVGMRTVFDLGEHWRLSLRGDIGGFDIDGSDFSWQLVAAVGHEWRYENWRLTLFGGYRALGQDYSKDDVVWNVVTHGPILGLCATFEF